MKKLLAIATLSAILSTVAPAHAMCNNIGNMIRIFGRPVVKASPFIGAYMWGRFKGETIVKNEDICRSNKNLLLCKSSLAEADFARYNTLIRSHVFNRCRYIGFSRDEIYTENIAHANLKSVFDYDFDRRNRWSSIAKKLQKEFDQITKDIDLLHAYYTV